MCDESKCEHPEKLKGKPGECSPEQVKECHGDADSHPCTGTEVCEHPEKLKGSADECSPEQIRECHGSDESHPCSES